MTAFISPRAAGPVLTFWHCAGEPLFRDADGWIRPVHVIRLRCVRHALWRMAREARGDERTRLCTIYAEATEALADTMAWRMAGVREAVSFVLSQPGGAS